MKFLKPFGGFPHIKKGEGGNVALYIGGKMMLWTALDSGKKKRLDFAPTQSGKVF